MKMITGIDFDEYNERRAFRGAEAARFKVYYDDGEWESKWMSKRDIVKNIALFPEHCEELNKGLKAYSA
jgi:hypothetical protein